MQTLLLPNQTHSNFTQSGDINATRKTFEVIFFIGISLTLLVCVANSHKKNNPCPVLFLLIMAPIVCPILALQYGCHRLCAFFTSHAERGHLVEFTVIAPPTNAPEPALPPVNAESLPFTMVSRSLEPHELLPTELSDTLRSSGTFTDPISLEIYHDRNTPLICIPATTEYLQVYTQESWQNYLRNSHETPVRDPITRRAIPPNSSLIRTTLGQLIVRVESYAREQFII